MSRSTLVFALTIWAALLSPPPAFAQHAVCEWAPEPSPGGLAPQNGVRGKETETVIYTIQGFDKDTCIAQGGASSLKGDDKLTIQPVLGWVGPMNDQKPRLVSGRCDVWGDSGWIEETGTQSHTLTVTLRMIPGRNSVSFKDKYDIHDAGPCRAGPLFAHPLTRQDFVVGQGQAYRLEVVTLIDHNKGDMKTKATNNGNPLPGLTIQATQSMNYVMNDPLVNQDTLPLNWSQSTDSNGDAYFPDVWVGIMASGGTYQG
jgi:hypothetical protein